MPVLAQVIDAMGHTYRHVIVRAPTLEIGEIERYKSEVPFEIVDNAADALSIADAALVKSGTSTVETALFGVPFAVFYKTSAISYQIALRAIKVSSIAMVNLLANRPIVREFVQAGASPENLTRELHALLGDSKYRRRIQQELGEVVDILGEGGAASRAAQHIVQRFL
jgi:lipid-A-disaccharide synthase